MSVLKKTIAASVVLSETIHVFCCVLPTVFAILSLIAGLGFTAVLPTSLVHFHDAIHDHEFSLIIISGIILALGWALYGFSRRLDCRTEGACHHAPCEPKKDKTKILMVLASALFIVNTTIYFLLHASA